METTRSKDGTPIAFDRVGQGPPLILVDGALCYRASGPSGPLAAALAGHFTVFTYDRRGRGDSGNTLPFDVAREVDDLGAVIAAAGGSAFVYGVSSGAALALEGAHRGLAISRLALYEAPFVVDDSYPPMAADFMARLEEAIAENRRGDAVKLFLRRVGVPGIVIVMMRLFPVWSTLSGVAHTLPHDIALVEEFQRGRPLSARRWQDATVATLVMDGGKSPLWMRHGMRALADVLPNASYRTLPGQMHMIKPRAHVQPLVGFFKG